MTDSIDQHVNWFRQSSPYINAHRGKTFVIMLGGDTLAHDQFQHIIHDIALLNSLGVRLVLVHGARPQIDELCELKKQDVTFADNKRITDKAMLVTVQQAVGQLRSQIEAILTTGMSNSPMHGADIRVVGGNFVIAKPMGVIDGVDFGHTGEVRKIDVRAINKALDNNAIALLNCLGYSRTGETFNLSVEDVATEAAIALQADKLILFGENNCIKRNGQLVKEVVTSTISQLLAQGLNPEQTVQLNAASFAVTSGVKRCQLIQHSQDGALLTELFTLDGCGTLVSLHHQEQLRTARMEDVMGILDLLSPLEEKGILVRRSRKVLETEIDRFRVLVKDGMVLGCAALYPYGEDMAELACVAVHDEYRSGQRGDRLLNTLVSEAKNQGIKNLFVLTTRTAQWFEERGFKAADIDDLPPQKKELYNYQRNSKVFIKAL
ncbi:MAG: amino-acid N-acetyltransferase [Oceanicoccus sp.]